MDYHDLARAYADVSRRWEEAVAKDWDDIADALEVEMDQLSAKMKEVA